MKKLSHILIVGLLLIIGISEPAELSTLTDPGLNSIGLDYKESKKTDSYGNRWMYRAKVKDKNDAQLGRWAWGCISGEWLLNRVAAVKEKRFIGIQKLRHLE